MMPYNALLGSGNNFPCIYTCYTPNQQMCIPMQQSYSPCLPHFCQSPFNYYSAPPSCHAPTIYLALPPKAAEIKTPTDESPPDSPISQPTPVPQSPTITQFGHNSEPTLTTYPTVSPQHGHENFPVSQLARTSQLASNTRLPTPPMHGNLTILQPEATPQTGKAALPKQDLNRSAASQMLLNLPPFRPTPTTQNWEVSNAGPSSLVGLKLLLDLPPAPQNQNVQDVSARDPPLEGSPLLPGSPSVEATTQKQNVTVLSAGISVLERSQLPPASPSAVGTTQNQDVTVLSAGTPLLEESQLLPDSAPVEGTTHNQDVKVLSAEVPPSGEIPEEWLVAFSDEAILQWEDEANEREAELKALLKQPITDKYKPLIPMMQITLAQKNEFVEGAKKIRKVIYDMKRTRSEKWKERYMIQLDSMITDLQLFYLTMFEMNQKLIQLKNQLLHGHPFEQNVGFNPEELNTSELFSSQNIKELKTIYDRQNEYLLHLGVGKKIPADQKALLQLYEGITKANECILTVLKDGENLNNKFKNATTEEEKSSLEKDLENARQYTLLFFERIKYLREQIAQLLNIQQTSSNANTKPA